MLAALSGFTWTVGLKSSAPGRPGGSPGGVRTTYQGSAAQVGVQLEAFAACFPTLR